MDRFKQKLLAVHLLSAALLLASQSVSAQSEAMSTNSKEPFSSSIERRRAEQELRSLPQKLREYRAPGYRNPKALKRMNEDFLGLQTLRAEMVRSFAAGNFLDRRVLKKSANEIKDRALRLRTSLGFFQDAGGAEFETTRMPTVESVNERAFRLCLEISQFTANPIFKTNGVLAARHVPEAAKSLDLIISLAAAVEKESGRLK